MRGTMDLSNGSSCALMAAESARLRVAMASRSAGVRRADLALAMVLKISPVGVERKRSKAPSSDFSWSMILN